MDHFIRVDSVEKTKAELCNQATTVSDTDQEELEEDEALIQEHEHAVAAARCSCSESSSSSSGDIIHHHPSCSAIPQVKEISAPYAVPHYPIELEEHKKIVAQSKLKELEERATTLKNINNNNNIINTNNSIVNNNNIDHPDSNNVLGK